MPARIGATRRSRKKRMITTCTLVQYSVSKIHISIYCDQYWSKLWLYHALRTGHSPMLLGQWQSRDLRMMANLTREQQSLHRSEDPPDQGSRTVQLLRSVEIQDWTRSNKMIRKSRRDRVSVGKINELLAHFSLRYACSLVCLKSVRKNAII